MKRTVSIVSILCILLLGIFFRFDNLNKSVVWDSDAACYSLFIKKYHQVIDIAKQPIIKNIYNEVHQSNKTFAQNIKLLTNDSRFKKLVETIPDTSIPFEHPSKPLFIICIS